MCSRPLRPLGFPIYVARRPAAPFARCYPRSQLPVRLGPFYVADPFSSIETRSFPNSLVATLAILPSMSLIPSAPFILHTSYFCLYFAASNSTRMADTLTSVGMKPVSE